MSLRAHLFLLRGDCRGSVALEFALIGPAMMAMLLAVLQFGIGMQNYNAMRSSSADVARAVAVSYQRGVKPTDTQIATIATNRASTAPYGLNSTRLTVTAATVGTSRIVGAKEITLTMTYQVRSVLSFFGLPNFTMTYARPIFVQP